MLRHTMTTKIPPERNVPGFERELAKCLDPLLEMVTYLRTTARNAGPDVIERRYKPQSGWGITYYAGTKVFLDVHPKVRERHVWVSAHGVDRAALLAERFQPSKQRRWFKIRSMREAVRFVKWIVEAHD